MMSNTRKRALIPYVGNKIPCLLTYLQIRDFCSQLTKSLYTVIYIAKQRGTSQYILIWVVTVCILHKGPFLVVGIIWFKLLKILYNKGKWNTLLRGNSLKMVLPLIWKELYSKRKEFTQNGLGMHHVKANRKSQKLSKFFPSVSSPLKVLSN